MKGLHFRSYVVLKGVMKMNFMLNHLNNIEIPAKRFDIIPAGALIDVEMYLQSPNCYFMYKGRNMTEVVNNSSIVEDLGKYDYLAYARKPIIAVWTDTDEQELKFTNKNEADQYYSIKGMIYSDIVIAFILGTWLVKDSSVYSDSYYWCNTDVGYTVKGHLNFQQTNSAGKMSLTSFSEQEIEDASGYMLQIMNIMISGIENNEQIETVYSQESYILNTEAAIGNNGRSFCRIIILLQLARKTGFISEKINWYCVILECLFAISNNHKKNISEMTAAFISESLEEKKQIINTMRDAYKVRSEFVHGDTISSFENNMQLAELSGKVDDFVRRALHRAFGDSKFDYENTEKDKKRVREYYRACLRKVES